MIHRKTTKKIAVGKVFVGGTAPVSVQSMTNTKTENVLATVQQIHALESVGCDIVRVAVPNMEAALAIQQIKEQINIPIIADIHFDYRLALAAMKAGCDGLRINPGNIGNNDAVEQVVNCAKKYNTPIRIGVNAGSLPKDILTKHGGQCAEAMLEAAFRHINILQDLHFYNIKISMKAHDVPLTIAAYKKILDYCDYPLHLGITEAGTINSGVVKSAVGIGTLLANGIGDTLRVSLTGDPVNEVIVGFEILKSLGLREYGPTLIACPTCGRTDIDLSKLALEVERRLARIKQPIKVAVMGCVVNGPGEAREADVGIAGGKGEGLVFARGEIVKKVPESELVNALFEQIDIFLKNKKL